MTKLTDRPSLGSGFRSLALSLLVGLGAVVWQTRAEAAKPDLSLVKQALGATKSQWVAFRNYNGRQLVYFTQILSWKCGLMKIRYVINEGRTFKDWPIPECNPDAPYAIDPEKDQVYLSLPLGTAKTVGVQLVFTDRNETELVTFKPCDVKGDATCGKRAD